MIIWEEIILIVPLLCAFFFLRRAVAQRCPSPPMKNLISVGGQHQGRQIAVHLLIGNVQVFDGVSHIHQVQGHSLIENVAWI